MRINLEPQRERRSTGKPVFEALQYAIRAHGQQRYGEYPYAFHLRGVMAATVRLGFNDPQSQIVAALHDVLEDTPVTFEQLSRRFDAPIAEAVRQLSRLPEVPEEDYVQGMGDLAFAVKLGDRLSNLCNHGRGVVTFQDLQKQRHRTLPKYRQEQACLEKRAKGNPLFEEACALIRGELEAAEGRIDRAWARLEQSTFG